MEVGTTSLTFFYGIYYVGWFLINLLAGVYIYRDAKKLPQLFLNSKPIWWFFSSLFLGGIWCIFVYWAIHHSSFSNRLGEKIHSKSSNQDK